MIKPWSSNDREDVIAFSMTLSILLRTTSSRRSWYITHSLHRCRRYTIPPTHQTRHRIGKFDFQIGISLSPLQFWDKDDEGIMLLIQRRSGSWGLAWLHSRGSLELLMSRSAATTVVHLRKNPESMIKFSCIHREYEHWAMHACYIGRWKGPLVDPQNPS